jgi:hypothetical protein
MMKNKHVAILALIEGEFISARKKFKSFNSSHEGIKGRIGPGPFIVKDMQRLGPRTVCYIWVSTMKLPTSVDAKYLVKV